MRAGVGRLLLDSELDAAREVKEDTASRRTAFVIDRRHALTAWHCACDADDGADPLWLRLINVTDYEGVIDVPVRVADRDVGLDAAVLELDPGRAAHTPVTLDLGALLGRVALPLGEPAVVRAPIRTEGFPGHREREGLAYTGSVTDPAANLSSGVRALQLQLTEIGTAVPATLGGVSGGPVLSEENHSRAEVVVGLVRSFLPDGIYAVGGIAIASRIQDLAARFPAVATALATRARTILSVAYNRQPSQESSLAALVRADSPHATAFFGRTAELSELHSWCTSDASRASRLITGPGGQGKTRLARQLCDQLNANGEWIACALRGPGEDNDRDIGLALAAHTGQRVLMVVDYAAEYGSVELRKLLTRLGDRDRSPAEWRLLLLARHTGEWWDGDRLSFLPQLRAAGVEVTAQPLQLQALVAAVDDRRRLFRAIVEQLRGPVTRFAAHYQLTVTDTPAMPPLHRSEYGSALLLHVSAVCSLLPAAAPGISPASHLDPTQVIDGLLDLERDYHWLYQDNNRTLYQSTEEAFGDLAKGSVGRGRIETLVAAATLVGAVTQFEAQEIVTAAVPKAAARAEEIALWLHDLYPPPTEASATDYFHPLQPDLLSEELIVRVINRQRGAGSSQHQLLPFSLAPVCTDKQTQRLLTVLIRAGERHGHIADLVGGRDHGSGTDPSSLLGHIDPATDLTTVEQALPRYNAHLLGVAVGITQHVLSRTPLWSSARAQLLLNLAYRLSVAGQRTQALDSAREAVEYYRQFAKSNSEDFLPALAKSLTNLAHHLSDVGQLKNALDASREAVEIWRPLAQDNSDAHLADLSWSLNNLAEYLAKARQYEHALANAQEAVEILRRLAEADPGTHLADLATSLRAFAVRLAQVQQPKKALTAAQEGVEILRSLAEANPGAHQPGLASSLSNLAEHLSEVEQYNEALTTAEEAVTINRRLAEDNREAFLPDLAQSLSRLAIRRAQIGQRDEALAAAQEATAIRRHLAEVTPDTFLPDLAISLTNLARHLTEVGQREEAVTAAQEATAIRRHLAKTATNAELLDLADSLTNLSYYLSRVGQHDQATAATQEATQIQRQLE